MAATLLRKRSISGRITRLAMAKAAALFCFAKAMSKFPRFWSSNNGRLMAPGTWPLAYSLAVLTSIKIAPSLTALIRASTLTSATSIPFMTSLRGVTSPRSEMSWSAAAIIGPNYFARDRRLLVRLLVVPLNRLSSPDHDHDPVTVSCRLRVGRMNSRMPVWFPKLEMPP